MYVKVESRTKSLHYAGEVVHFIMGKNYTALKWPCISWKLRGFGKLIIIDREPKPKIKVMLWDLPVHKPYPKS